jgi:hypothetical protein
MRLVKHDAYFEDDKDDVCPPVFIVALRLRRTLSM